MPGAFVLLSRLFGPYPPPGNGSAWPVPRPRGRGPGIPAPDPVPARAWESRQPTLSGLLLRNPGGSPCLSSRASSASRGISNFRPLPLGMVEPCLGAINTKESLSFGKQPSLFKGRNQSWFHPLRTPSRPGAAAPGLHGGWGQAVVSPHTIYRPRCTDRQLLGVEGLLTSYNLLRTTQGCALVVTPESRRLPLTVIPSEWNESRDLQLSAAVT